MKSLQVIQVMLWLILLIMLLFALVIKANAAPTPQAPIIHEVTCTDVTVAWSNPPEPPVTSPFAGTMYFQKEGEVTEFGTLEFDLFASGAYYYKIEFDFEENEDYRLNCFLKGANSGGIYWCANGNTWWTPCRKIRIRLPILVKG